MTALLTGVLIAVVGLGLVEKLAARSGAVRWRPARRRIVLGALAVLLAVGWVAPSLGLRYGASLVPRLLAAALFLLLLVYLWQLLPRLRPLLGPTLPARPPWLFVLLPFVVYLAIMPWSTAERPPDGDEPYYLLVTHSLVHDLDVDLTNNYSATDSLRFLDRALEPQQGDPVGREGELYSRHNALLPAALAPAYLVAGKFGALATMCLLAALLCWWTLRVARHWFADSPGAVLAAYFVLAFTSPLLLYSHQVWVEIPAALLLTMAVEALWSLDESSNPRSRWLLLIAPLLVLPLLKIRFFLIALPLLALAAWKLGSRSRRWALTALAGFVVLAAGILVFNQLQYGNPLKYHNLSKLSFYWTELDRYPRGLAGLFFDAGFGLFATSPIWLLLFVARPKFALLTQSLAISGPYLLALVPRSEWYGAWSPPFRYGCFALALMTLCLVPALRDRRRGQGARLVVGALAGSTALLNALWVMRPGWTYNFAHGRTHLLDIVSKGQAIDIARFFPTALRPNLALWIWPPVVLLSAWLLWRWRPKLRHAWWLGATLPLLLVAVLLNASHRRPTRLIEVEDAYVTADGGELFPGLWVTGRTRYRGGWRLTPGVSLEIPIVPGGRSVALAVDLRRVGRRPARTYLKIGPKSVGPATAKLPRENRWSTVEIDPIEWPEGEERLVVSVKMPRRAPETAALLIDRIALRWSPEPPGEGED